MYTCYLFDGKLTDTVEYNSVLKPQHFMGNAQDDTIAFLLSEKNATEIGRDYYNNKGSVKIEIEWTTYKTFREVYVITQIFHIDEIKAKYVSLS